ncbi:MAG: type I phosphodiesterase/nucleotide [Planctomycetota bacterium]|nr:MAG: type I phosphodiesterase/nucleotide [Planctomycetota bacterium]
MRFTTLVLLAVACAVGIAGCAKDHGEGNDGKAASRRQLLVLSLDGLPWDLAQQKMAAGKLPNIAALVARGASASDGSLSSFPARTAPAHATLWTGCWSDRTKILGNETPVLPRTAHTILEVRPGFDAAALAAEPVWRVAARAGRSVTVVQATHAEPDNDEDRGMPGLHIFNGYRNLVRSAIVTGPAFAADDQTFSVERDGDSLLVASAPLRVRVPFATWVAIDHPAVRGVFYLYLARIDRTGWSLLRSSYSTVAAPSAADAARFRQEVGGYAFNAQKLDPSLLDGTEWKRNAYLAATKLNTAQVKKAVLWAMKNHPADLTIAYLPQPDEALHDLLGKVEIWGDREAAATLDEVLAVCDSLAGDLATALGPEGSIAVVSDHGMAPVDHVFYPNLVLERAGLLARSATGGVNLAATQVLFGRAGDFLTVNTLDRLGGIVPPEEKEAWLSLAEREITRAAEASLGPGALLPPFRPGTNSADLSASPEGDAWISAACDGVRLFALLSPDLPEKDSPLARELSPPMGYHSGDPRITRLRAMLVFAGPGFRRGEATGVRHVDFAPTVLKWLGVTPAGDMAGSALEDFLEKP